MIDELTQNLYEEFREKVEILLSRYESDALFLDNKELQAVLCLEIANGYLLFHRTQKANDCIELAGQILNITLNVEGEFLLLNFFF